MPKRPLSLAVACRIFHPAPRSKRIDVSAQSPPYPAETRAKGWRFELDLEQIEQSDTWALASPDLRPWLLMLWSVSWKQLPCGSIPDDDDIIAARIGMKLSVFKKARTVLLRGWWRADDGRLYHPTVTQRVLTMLETKQKEKDRKAAYRAKASVNVPRDNHGTTEGHTPDGHGIDPGRDATSTSTSTGTSTGVNLKTPGTDVPGGKPPAMNPDEIIFTYGLPLLTNAGTPEKQARSFLGGLRKAHGDEALIDKLRECLKTKPLQPLEWLAAALPPTGSGPRKPAPENFNAINYGTGGRL